MKMQNLLTQILTRVQIYETICRPLLPLLNYLKIMMATDSKIWTLFEWIMFQTNITTPTLRVPSIWNHLLHHGKFWQFQYNLLLQFMFETTFGCLLINRYYVELVSASSSLSSVCFFVISRWDLTKSMPDLIWIYNLYYDIEKYIHTVVPQLRHCVLSPAMHPHLLARSPVSTKSYAWKAGMQDRNDRAEKYH